MTYRQIVGAVQPGAIRGPVIHASSRVVADVVVDIRDLREPEAAPIRGLETSRDPTVEMWRLHGVVSAWSVADRAAYVRVIDPRSLSQFLVWLPFDRVTSLKPDQLGDRLPEELMMTWIEQDDE